MDPVVPDVNLYLAGLRKPCPPQQRKHKTLYIQEERRVHGGRPAEAAGPQILPCSGIRIRGLQELLRRAHQSSKDKENKMLPDTGADKGTLLG